MNVYETTETGLEAMERLRFLAPFPLPGTSKREREEDEKTQPFNRFASNPVTIKYHTSTPTALLSFLAVTLRTVILDVLPILVEVLFPFQRHFHRRSGLTLLLAHFVVGHVKTARLRHRLEGRILKRRPNFHCHDVLELSLIDLLLLLLMVMVEDLLLLLM